jgi:hypothetical protein
MHAHFTSELGTTNPENRGKRPDYSHKKRSISPEVFSRSNQSFNSFNYLAERKREPVSEEIRQLEEQLNAADRDAQALVHGLSEELGTWHANAGSWSVAECLDHLSITNRAYLDAMRSPASQALKSGRRGALRASPGFVGRFFVHSLEPPVKPRLKGKSPQIIRPQIGIVLGDALSGFTTSQAEVHAFVREFGDIDLSGVLFPNPFVKWLRFSLATGLHVIAAHERRHLWQGWNVRRAAESMEGRIHRP